MKTTTELWNRLSELASEEFGDRAASIQEAASPHTMAGVPEWAHLVAQVAANPTEPDWHATQTGPDKIWKDPNMPIARRLGLADEAIGNRDRIIENLQAQLAAATRASQPVIADETPECQACQGSGEVAVGAGRNVTAECACQLA